MCCSCLFHVLSEQGCFQSFAIFIVMKVHLHSISCDFFLFSHRNGMLICNFMLRGPPQSMMVGLLGERISFCSATGVNLTLVVCLSLLSIVSASLHGPPRSIIVGQLQGSSLPDCCGAHVNLTFCFNLFSC